MKDWKGNSKSTYITLGASNHTEKEREPNDYYSTDPAAVEMLLGLETFSKYVWECACGAGHLSEALERNGHCVWSTDIIDRGFRGMEVADFLQIKKEHISHLPPMDIITNPPYKYAKEFVEHALEVSMDGTKIAMFLKLQFLEGKARAELFKKHPPKVIYVSSSRILCAKNGDFEKMKQGGGSAVAYAWYIWEKGYKGNTIVKWFN